MVQILSINFFVVFLQFLLGFSNIPGFYVSACISGTRYTSVLKYADLESQ